MTVISHLAITDKNADCVYDGRPVTNTRDIDSKGEDALRGGLTKGVNPYLSKEIQTDQKKKKNP